MTIVPTFVFINELNVVVKKIEGMDDIENVAAVTTALQSLMNTTSTNNTKSANADVQQQKQHRDEENDETDPAQKLNQKLKSLIHSSPIMLFMKGSPTQPKCGFSRQAVELLSSSKLSFGSFDILSNEEVRQGLKVYSDWPTYPQLYVNGELVGGLDIMKEMYEENNGDLKVAFGLDNQPPGPNDVISRQGSTSVAVVSLEDRLKALVQRSKVMLFMKGLPSQPRCGFSRQICELLTQENVEFDAFDILSDEEVRQGLKTYSDWPTYPQLYVDGELVGGLDIVKELIESGEFTDMI